MKNQEGSKKPEEKISIGPVIHQSLPDAFVRRVLKIKKALAEVENVSLENTLDNFRRDLEPKKELMIWEHIAAVFQAAMVKGPGFSPDQKKDIFRVLLSLSLGVEDFSTIKTIKKETIGMLKNLYKGNHG